MIYHHLSLSALGRQALATGQFIVTAIMILHLLGRGNDNTLCRQNKKPLQPQSKHTHELKNYTPEMKTS